jgi:thioredoxin 1
MKKTLKVLLPVAAALVVALAVPHLRHEGGCSCQAPVVVFGSLFGCGDANQADSINAAVRKDESTAAKENAGDKKSAGEFKVTFVEIGSVNCIPCKMMKPIMNDIEKEYGDQVKIVFHDVWTSRGKADAQRHGIRVIPTQVFLDTAGNEYFRHEGFFPKEDLVKVLQMKGVR